MAAEDPHTYNLPSDEIDLRTLIVALWQGKWIILSTIFIAVALAISYLVLVPAQLTASLHLKPISHADLMAYNPLKGNPLITIDQAILMQRFVDQLDNRETLIKAMLALDYVKPHATEATEEYQKRFDKLAFNLLKLTPPSKDGNLLNQSSWQLTVTTLDPELTKQLINETLIATNKQIQLQLQNQFALNIRAYQTSLYQRLEENQIQQDSLIDVYQNKTASRTALLAEQAAIARKLDVEKDLFITLVENQSSALDMQGVRAQQPHYSQGYLALEQELNQINSRDGANLDKYIPELTKHKQNHFLLEHDKTIERSKKASNLTPLFNSTFRAVEYDMAQLQWQSKMRKPLLLVLAGLLGAMFGLFVLVLVNTLKGTKSLNS